VDAPFERVGATIREAMGRLGVPGVALGVLEAGRTLTAGFGVDNVEHPRPVEPTTIFRIASISKTFTATAVMRLVEQGRLDLDAPLRRFVPDLRLADPVATERATLRHCLNHYGGWTGDVFDDYGRGDDALARYVAYMAEVPQLTPLGRVWSYNNAGFCLAGRAVELATGLTFERAIQELLLDPLGMARTFFFAEDVVVEPVAARHVALDDGPRVVRPWLLPRAGHAMGGLLSCVDDLLRWARFHLGDGTAPDGARLLRRETLDHMHAALAPAGSLADAIGVAFQTTVVAGVPTVGHGGSWLGQLSSFRLVESRDFAVVVLTNGHRGAELHGRATAAALAEHLGLVPPPRQLIDPGADRLREHVGAYEAAIDDVALSLRDGALVLEQTRRMDIMAARPESPHPPPVRLGFVADDRVVGLDPPSEGARGEFLRGADGQIEWFRWGGRIHRRAPTARGAVRPAARSRPRRDDAAPRAAPGGP
jgi:CubicO group peptidase (beta-lactamase class C family)